MHNTALQVVPYPPLSKGDCFPSSRESLRNCQAKRRGYCLEAEVVFAVNVVYLDFSKAFKTVSRSVLLEKLPAHVLDRALCWVKTVWVAGPREC